MHTHTHRALGWLQIAWRCISNRLINYMLQKSAGDLNGAFAECAFNYSNCVFLWYAWRLCEWVVMRFGRRVVWKWCHISKQMIHSTGRSSRWIHRNERMNFVLQCRTNTTFINWWRFSGFNVAFCVSNWLHANVSTTFHSVLLLSPSLLLLLTIEAFCFATWLIVGLRPITFNSLSGMAKNTKFNWIRAFGVHFWGTLIC